MSDGPGPDDPTRRRMASIIAELVETVGADAVIVAVTRQRRRSTETFAIPFGNVHAVHGLAEFVYGHLSPDELEADQADADEIGEDDQEDEA